MSNEAAKSGRGEGGAGLLDDCANRHGRCRQMYKIIRFGGGEEGGNKPDIESTDYMEQSCSVLTRKGV